MGLIFNGTTITGNNHNIKFNGHDLNKVIFNGTTVWEKASSLLTFTSVSGGSFTLNVPTGATRPTLYYNKNGTGWAALPNATIAMAAGDSVQLRGTNATFSNSSYANRFAFVGDMKLSGDIMSLISADLSKDAVPDWCFRQLFQANSSMVLDTEDLVIGAKTFGFKSCYRLFWNSAKVTHMADMPNATTIGTYSFMEAYSRCTEITSTRAFKATTLNTGSYFAMFKTCTGLLSHEKIEATVMNWDGNTEFPGSIISTVPGACAYMFEGCTSLATIPALPQINYLTGKTNIGMYGIGIGDCARMYMNCTSLNVNSTHDFTDGLVLGQGTFVDLFYGCVSLSYAPALPATTLQQGCYSGMFQYCQGLITPPVLPATVMAKTCYSSMFYSCRNMTSTPVLPSTQLAPGCYASMFAYCVSLTAAPVLPATVLPEVSNTSGVYQGMFMYCSGLTAAPALPATSINASCYQNMFYQCTNLVTPPELPATTLYKNCYNQMFGSCTKLTSAPALLPATVLEEQCYYSMFMGCTSLTTPPRMDGITTLAYQCCTQMFSGCTSLTALPILEASIGLTNANTPYYNMFSGCTQIMVSATYDATTYTTAYRIPMYGQGDATQTTAATNMFAGTGGTFKGSSVPNTTYFTANRLVPDNILTFVNHGSTAATITISSTNTSYVNPQCVQSLDGGSTWNTMSATSGNTVSIPAGSSMMMRASTENQSWVNGTKRAQFSMSGSNNIEIKGNLYYLINASGSISVTNARQFVNLFNSCTCIKSIKDLVICADYILGSNMFKDCTGIEEVPTRPIETIKIGYSGIFSGCTSIITAPNVRVVSDASLSSYCSGCVSLTEIPKICAMSNTLNVYSTSLLSYLSGVNVGFSATQDDTYKYPYTPFEGATGFTGTDPLIYTDSFLGTLTPDFTSTFGTTFYSSLPVTA